MFPYIVCLSCGRNIGSLWPAFKAMRADAHEAAVTAAGYDVRTVNERILASSGAVTVELGEILDQLGINMECCRTKMLTQKPFYDYY